MPPNTARRQTSGWQASSQVSEPAPGVFFVEGPASNWIIVKDQSGFILIDSGYPADRTLVIESIEHVGLVPSDAQALLITHGHADHTGSAAYFSDTYGTPVLCSPEELRQVQGVVKHQIGFAQVLPRAWNPRVFRWAAHAIAAGSLTAKPATAARAWSVEELRGLPGSPQAIVVSGHTPGNVSLLLAAVDVIVTGDSFITGHALSRHTGPQMLHRMFHHEPVRAVAALEALAGVDASVILPGHGPALSMPLSDALASLRI
ncbi:MBL fold metallo-hydrolase [Paeniglutamicibacter antarcticus]|uniref:MBL fold metallo-hydrolase n=1 Tax=Arthrobacter terrae TaxID=2935737 RepID=A0A931CPP1_9MICC|nr:MBL fold metallo-hydrolase [Arthrobacter terrae]MBG0738714.1 MBL fold metallo-hydrolase [Arthrobacter terrae]